MKCKRHDLYEAYLKLLNIGGQCNESVAHECQVAQLTRRQVYYLRIIDQYDDMTFSKLADVTSNSKPTITEVINKFILWDCVYKEKSHRDKRVCYIHLTPKGKQIARSEEMAQFRIIERIEKSLEDEEVSALIALLNKLD